MNSQDFINFLMNLIKKGFIEETLELLTTHTKKKSPHYVDAIMLSARFYQLEKENRLNTKTDESYQLSRNKIIGSLIDLLSQMTTNAFVDPIIIPEHVQDLYEPQEEGDSLVIEQVKEYSSIQVKYGPLRDEIALIIDISYHPISIQVKRFLENKAIPATPIFITLKGPERELDVTDNEQWRGVIKGISTLLRNIYEDHPPIKLHIFLSVPLALAFGIGCTIQNLARPYIYHFDRDSQKYIRILIGEDKLR